MQIGFTSTSFRQIRSVDKIVKIACETGVDCIEWGGDVHIKDTDTARLAKKLCDDAGIKISSYGSYYRVGSRNEDEWKRICETAGVSGAQYVRVWLGKRDSEKTDDKTYKLLLEDTRAICSQAKNYGLAVCAECHDNTFNNNTEAFLRLYEDAQCDNFRTYFQSRYKRMEYDLDRIERTMPYIPSVHLSFSEQRREQFPRYNPTYLDTLLEKIMQMGFDGNYLLEYTYFGGHFGLPSYMKKDVEKLKEKVGR